MAVAPILAVLTALGLFVLIVLPVILVLVSHRSNETAKFCWFVATLLFSWVGFLVFLVTTEKPNGPQSNIRYAR